MIKIYYYAHSMKIYNTEQERKELDVIEQFIGPGCIFNPNRHFIQNHQAPMRACIDVVKDESITDLIFSGVFGYITQGVYFEISIAQKLEKPIFYLEPFNNKIEKFEGIFVHSKNKKVSRWSVLNAGNHS
jgi:hypothetical protein